MISFKNECLFQANQQFSIEFIERQLRKFGAIESIEILSNERCEAYVTFVDDRNAYLALAHNELQSMKRSRVFNIQPADSWVQPKEASNEYLMDDEYTPPIFMLNEDCILELIKYLDFNALVNMSQVCKLFNRILHQHRFSRYREFSIENGSSLIPMPLAKVRQSLICVGPYISELRFEWHDYDHINRLQRFLEKIGQYAGKNVIRLRLRDTRLQDEHIPAVERLLKQLETLEIIAYNPDFDLDLDFSVLCPKLRKLKLLENMQFIRCCKPWPKLQHLSIVGNEFMAPNTFRSFIEQNQQLMCLKFTAYNADERLQAVAQSLPNVEKLTILPSFPNLSATNIVYLSSLQHLTKLNLMYLDEDDVNDILRCLTRFTGLRTLKLHLFFDSNDEDGHFEPNQQALIALAHELPHLERFYTRYIRWKESTLIDFIRHASQLNALHIHWCDLPTTNAMIWKVVKVLQTNRPQPQTAPLQLYVNPSDSVGLQMINDQDLTRYLNVSTKCRHFKSN